MNFGVVAAVSASILAMLAIALLAPLGLAAVDGDRAAIQAYGASFLLVVVTAILLRYLGRHASAELHRKDALGVVALTWIALGFFGGLPFVLEGSIPNLASALFESVSGFTTTGATVVGNVDALSRATNLWRCLMHWLGGMGIVVLFVAVFPKLGVGGKLLFKSEAPGPMTEGLRPHIKQTAIALWWIYAGLTGSAIAVLWLLGMPIFDATIHAMSALGTGGYSSRGASIGAYDNAWIDWTISAYMLLASLNFGLYYGLLRGKWRDMWRNGELRFYLTINAVVIAVITALILPRHGELLEALRFATFQTLAVTTTTGFMTEDFDTYPDLARYLLFLCMFIGGCAGSTSGGIKASRIYMLFAAMRRELDSLVSPNRVSLVQVSGQSIAPRILEGVAMFLFAYLVILAIGTLALVLCGLDMISAASGTVACLSSVGPGLAAVGPSQNFGFIPGAGKVVLCICMIAGRLEIFALFALLRPECWRR